MRSRNPSPRANDARPARAMDYCERGGVGARFGVVVAAAMASALHLAACCLQADRIVPTPARALAGPPVGPDRPIETAMVETLRLAATRINTFVGMFPLTFERDGRLWRVTSRHFFLDRPGTAPTGWRSTCITIRRHGEVRGPLYRYGACSGGKAARTAHGAGTPVPPWAWRNSPSVPAWFAMMRWCEITNRRRHGPPDHHLE